MDTKDTIQALNDLFFKLAGRQYETDRGQISDALTDLDKLIKQLEEVNK